MENQLNREVGELVARLRESADCCEISSWMKRDYKALARAADLLERLVSPACLVINPSPEALASLKAAGPGRFEAMPAERIWPQPVTVSERLPGPEDCDEQGKCWWLTLAVTEGGRGGYSTFWELTTFRAAVRSGSHWLPFNALPLPEVTHG